ncbi:MAG: molecular chaperone TorD family protein [Ardenticatenaceae bacterium]|nr:molecular chaperone TorD family protein [Ardenticatenaceae bacterium]
MTPHSLALSRASGYQFLRMMIVQGITAETWPVVAQTGFWVGDPPDLDEAAAAHYNLFGMNLFPHAAVFLEEGGMVGGDAADAAVRLLERLGVPRTEPGGDHLAVFLGGLAFLCGAEADAREDGLEKVAHQMRHHQRILLNQGVAPWIWPFLAALSLQRDAFYRQIGRLTFDLIADHLGDGIDLPERMPLSLAAELLNDQATGLREIAGFLLTPSHSGWFLTREMIEGLARTIELPRGFGSREQTLINLLRAAAQYDLVPAVLDHLVEHLQKWADCYAGWIREMPILAPVIEIWERRLAQTHFLLRTMRPLVEEVSRSS